MKHKTVRVFLVCFVLTLLFSLKTFAASNQVLQIPVSFRALDEKASGEDEDKNVYTVYMDFAETVQIKKNTKISAKIIVPPSFFKKKTDSLLIQPGLELSNENSYLYGFTSRCWFTLSKKGKKPVLTGEDAKSGKQLKAGAFESVAKSGKYYIVSLKKLPLYEISPSDNQTTLSSVISGKKSYYAGVSLILTGSFGKNLKNKKIFIDDVVLKSGESRIIDFSEKSAHVSFHAENALEEELKIKTVPLNY